VSGPLVCRLSVPTRRNLGCKLGAWMGPEDWRQKHAEISELLDSAAQRVQSAQRVRDAAARRVANLEDALRQIVARVMCDEPQSLHDCRVRAEDALKGGVDDG